ncbi:MAG: hypothetical protein WCF08_10655 [Anaerolineaceae bacterium]
MITRSQIPKVIACLIFIIAFVVVVIQMYHTVNDYARVMRMPIWRLRTSTSFARSAELLLTPRGAGFLKFIQGIIPPNSKVVIPLFAGPFSEQNIMQFFMMDQSIFGCPRDNQIECLSKWDKYLIATFNYPPDESDINKTLIIYPEINELYPYKGIYLADNYTAGDYGAIYPDKYNLPLTALCDFGILLGWFLLGWVILALITRKYYHALTIIPAFPLGMGVFTWCLFLVCLAGAPLNVWTLAIVYILLIIPLGILALRSRQAFPGVLELFQEYWSGIKHSRINLPILVLGGFILLFFLLLIYISVGRGYSTFDDMAIWSLKGYYMAFKNDLFAAGQASGHGLSYPLNLPLAISSFFLVDMDLLPGSKLAYILLFVSMLVCIYWFLRNNLVSRKLALLGILLIISTPIIFYYATLGFANIPFTCYLVIGTLLSIHGITTKHTKLLYTSGVVLSLAGWTRPEGIGFSLFLAILVGLLGLKNRLRLTTIVLFLLSSISLSGTWMIVGIRYIQGDEIGYAIRSLLLAIETGSFSFSPIWMTLAYSWEQFTTINNWGYVVPLTLIIIIGLMLGLLHRVKAVTLTLTIAALGTFLIPLFMFVTKYFQGPDNYMSFLSVSFDRAQFPAVIFLVLAAILFTGSLYPTHKTKYQDC